MFSFISFELPPYYDVDVIDIQTINIDGISHEVFMIVKTRTTVQTGEEDFETYTEWERIKGVHPDKGGEYDCHMNVGDMVFKITEEKAWDKQVIYENYGY